MEGVFILQLKKKCSVLSPSCRRLHPDLEEGQEAGGGGRDRAAAAGGPQGEAGAPRGRQREHAGGVAGGGGGRRGVHLQRLRQQAGRAQAQRADQGCVRQLEKQSFLKAFFLNKKNVVL